MTKYERLASQERRLCQRESRLSLKQSINNVVGLGFLIFVLAAGLWMAGAFN